MVQLPMPRASDKPNARSRVGNGADLLPGTDGRSAGVRRYREVVSDLAHDLLGVSPWQAILVRRAAALVVWLEQAEASLANGERSFNIDSFVSATNTLHSLLQAVRGSSGPHDGYQPLANGNSAHARN
jgi:hypothetical protein